MHKSNSSLVTTFAFGEISLENKWNPSSKLYHMLFYNDEVPVVKCLPSLEMDKATRVQILDQANCILYSTITLWKGMNQIILPTAMGK